MRILISAGEASGDAYGAALLREIKRQFGDTKLAVQAAGGRRLREAGAEIVADSSNWGAIGIVQSVKVSPRVIRGCSSVKKALADGEPGLFVPIDFGFVNIRLCKHAKKHGWKVLYFIPPGSWRRSKQGADLPHLCDEIVSPFFWSAETLRKMGGNAHCFGHPLKQLVKEREAEMHAAGQEDRMTIAVLPGSRKPEIDLHLPIIAKALEGEARQAEIAVAPNVSAEELRSRWLALAPDRTSDKFTEGDTYGVLLRARAGVVCSGTATLEAALCVCPHVVLYRVTKMSELESKLVGFKEEYISQPNILLGKMAVPELVQRKGHPEALRQHLDTLLKEGDERRQQIFAFMEIDTSLGPPDAITKTADLALQLMGASTPEKQLTPA